MKFIDKEGNEVPIPEEYKLIMEKWLHAVQPNEDRGNEICEFFSKYMKECTDAAHEYSKISKEIWKKIEDFHKDSINKKEDNNNARRFIFELIILEKVLQSYYKILKPFIETSVAFGKANKVLQKDFVAIHNECEKFYKAFIKIIDGC